MERDDRLRFRLRRGSRPPVDLRAGSRARAEIVHAPKRGIVAIRVHAVRVVGVQTAVLPPEAVVRERVLVPVGVLDRDHPDVARAEQRRGSRVGEPANQLHRDGGRDPLPRVMGAHEQHVGPGRIVVGRTDFHREDRPPFDRGPNRVKLDSRIGGGPGLERRADPDARLVERLVHVERVGGGCDGHGARQWARGALRCWRDNDDRIQRPIDLADARDLEPEARQRVERGASRTEPDRYLDHAELGRRREQGGDDDADNER